MLVLFVGVARGLRPVEGAGGEEDLSPLVREFVPHPCTVVSDRGKLLMLLPRGAELEDVGALQRLSWWSRCYYCCCGHGRHDSDLLQVPSFTRCIKKVRETSFEVFVDRFRRVVGRADEWRRMGVTKHWNIEMLAIHPRPKGRGFLAVVL